MKLVLLSGGSGKRLWPLSNDSRSKQFLKLLDNEGSMQSMVQRIWGQVKGTGLDTNAIISTGKSQVEIIQNQLGKNVPLIVEPERKDTFPAIALASTFFYSVKKLSLDEIVCVLPVDSYVENEFFSKVKTLEKAIIDSNNSIALLGVSPTIPSQKYGYIVPIKNNENKYYEKVSHFKEKPSELEANELINQGALWNCGVFAFKLGFLISVMEKMGLPTKYEELVNQYHTLEKISFDYAVVEKTNEICVVKYEGFWKDLGSWNTLTEEMSQNLLGKGIISEECNNTHLINELEIPITVIGLDNAIVAASPDGILISDKNKSSKVKDILKDFEQRPMYEERRWGWYKVLDYKKFIEGYEVLTKRIGITAGKNLSYQKHLYRSEVWTVISGEGEFVLNDKMSNVKTGDVLVIPVEAKHGIRAISDMEIIEVQKGTQLIEDDIERIFINWEDLKRSLLTKVK